MKDVVHHHKHTQKKVIQSARKERLQELSIAAANESQNANPNKIKKISSSG